MAFKARLRFAGLCANVPDAPLDASPKIWVVMPDARSPVKESICKHFPGIFLDASRLADSSKAQAASSGVSSGFFFWGIERKEITIVPTGAGGAAVTELTIPNDDDDTDFRHVPDLGQIDPGAAAMNPDFKKDQGSLGLIAARVFLEQGMLRAKPRSLNVPAYFPQGKAFADVNEPYRFAHETILDLGELDRLEIHARDLDTEGDPKILSIEGGTAPCEICIGNLCAELWLKELGGIEPYLGDTSIALDDRDFEAFYYLSYPLPKNDPLGPVPRSKGGGSTGAKCHQAIFAPFIEE